MIDIINDQNEVEISQALLDEMKIHITHAVEMIIGCPFQVDLAIVDQDEIQLLNKQYRYVDEITDVLSFPAEEHSKPMDRKDLEWRDDSQIFLGDIAICALRALQQAMDYEHSLQRELCFLAVHGTLHLLGYDHISTDDERRMIDMQKKILGVRK